MLGLRVEAFFVRQSSKSFMLSPGEMPETLKSRQPIRIVWRPLSPFERAIYLPYRHILQLAIYNGRREQCDR